MCWQSPTRWKRSRGGERGEGGLRTDVINVLVMEENVFLPCARKPRNSRREERERPCEERWRRGWIE